MNSTIETSILSQSVLELSKEDLLKEHTQLKKISAGNQQEIENVKQQLFVAQREISRRNLIHQDQVAELELLQSNQQKKMKKLDEQLQSLENDLYEIKKMYELEYEKLFNESNLSLAKYEKLAGDLEVAQENYNTQGSVAQENMKMFETNLLLKQKVNALTQQLENLQGEMQVHINKKQELNENLNKIKLETERYQAKCNYNKSSLEEAKSLLETLEGNAAMLKMEHQGLRSGCKDDIATPNSLFGEVDERRVLLQNRVSKMKDTYMEKKNERAKLKKKLLVLQMENIQLTYSWNENRSGKDMDILAIKNSYKNSIQAFDNVTHVLEGLIIKRKTLGSKILSPKETQLVFDVNTKFDNKIRELESLLDGEQYTNFNYNYDLTKCQKNIEDLKKKIQKIGEKNNELKAEVEAAEQIELGGDPVCVCTLTAQKEKIMKNYTNTTVSSKENQQP